MNIEEYVDFSVQLIKSNIDPSKGYITAARLGLVLRQASGETTWQSLGYRTLSSFLRMVQGRGLITVGPNEKNALAIWIGEPHSAPAEVPETRSYNPLRKSVWSAFVLDNPAGRRYFHRTTGLVRAGITASPSPIDEWVEIKPIPQDEQRRWARDYIRSKKIEPQTVLDALDAPDWYLRITNAMASIDMALAKQWNRCRTLKISQLVEAWCTEHSLPNTLVFQPKTIGTAAPESVGKAAAQPSDPLQHRALVLAAIAEMTTDDLLEIPIAAKYLIKAIQSDSTRKIVG